ncbi:hypothetical protein N7495_005730 [Penicillium taxi]|uniref:uncharacterized protein n=1 Tax=Penicillium taxi TaxID=168475 RepID=UPI0025455791|nr:uncharacterized protein N7495_005730 [Penicillium taxi]KAJ5894039.1 hypothetical protein N7495_005730 [Penicillium taxi]
MAIPADILAAEAAGSIPSDVSLTYLAQSRDHPAIVGILFIICFTGVILIVRLYARFFLVKKVGLDDALAILTLVFYIIFVVLSIVLINMGSGRHIEYIQYVLPMSTVRQTEVLDFVAHIFYTTALFFCRLSGLAFYFRITSRSSILNKIIMVAAPFLFAAYLPQLFLLIFHCRPVTGLWPYSWQPEPINYTCLSWGLVYSVNSGISLVCDVMMFAIPAILIKQLHISMRKKIKLSIVMFPGVFVIVVSAIRIWLVVEGQWAADGSWPYNQMLCVENAEIASSLIALSVPALKPAFGNMFNHMTEYTESRTRSQSVGRLRTHQSRIVTNTLSSATRDDKRLIDWSNIGGNEYEMTAPEASHHPDDRRPRSKSEGIKVTNEVNIESVDDLSQSPTPGSPSLHASLGTKSL